MTILYCSYNPHDYGGGSIDFYPANQFERMENHHQEFLEKIQETSQVSFLPLQEPTPVLNSRGETEVINEVPVVNQTPLHYMNFNGYRNMIQNAPQLSTSDPQWKLLPEFYGSYIAFYLNDDNGIIGIQRTLRGGERFVFRIEFSDSDTHFNSPINSAVEIEIPDYIKDLTITQIPVWGWHDEPLPHITLGFIRRMHKNKFTPYPQHIQEAMEEYYKSKPDEKLNIEIGIISLEISFIGDIPPEFMLQNHNGRCHIAERSMKTQSYVDEYNEKLLKDCLDLCQDASGDTTDCAICIEKLNTSKCIKLPCKHVFHGLCAQTHASINGAFCAFCKQPSNIANSSSNITCIFSGR